MNLSIFDNDDNLGQESPVRLFTFAWPNVRSRMSNKTLGQLHAAFNARFTADFPRIANTTPWTSYTDAKFGITPSRLTGTCATRANDAVMRTWIIVTASTLGIDGKASDLQISSKEFAEIENGQVLNVPGITVNPLATTDGVNDFFSGLADDYKWPLVIGGGLLVLLLLRR